MRDRSKRVIDRLTSAWADRVWVEEKRKYKPVRTRQVLFGMIMARMALVNWTLLIALSCYVTWIYLQDTNNSRPLKAVYFDNVHMEEKEHGRVVGVMEADKVVRDETNERMHFVKVRYTMFKEADRVDMIKSRKALQYTRSRDMHFEGRVFVRSERPVMENGKVVEPRQMQVDRFYSERLDWSAHRKVLSSPEPVTMLRGGDIVVQGDKMKSFSREERTEVEGNVKVTIYNREATL